jgi:aryl-alcohol dehydrogenase-like predicted oxidoreductase
VPVEYRALGNTGLRVSAIALGCMAFGMWSDERESARVVDAALDAGINLLDTSDVYGPGMATGDPDQTGVSETILGPLLRGRRQRVVLATKVGRRVGRGPNDAGCTRQHVLDAVDASLRRLQTDHVDLYQLHAFDAQTPLEETLRALDDLVRWGKVRYVGCSNFTAWQAAKALGLSAANGWARFESIQPNYSLLQRAAEREILPFCRSEKVGAIVYSPLARGLLAGRYRPGEAFPAGTRAAAGDATLLRLIGDASNMAKVDRLAGLAADLRLPLATLALAWVLRQPGVTSALLGASRAEHVTASLAALEVTLSDAQWQAVDEASPLS